MEFGNDTCRAGGSGSCAGPASTSGEVYLSSGYLQSGACTLASYTPTSSWTRDVATRACNALQLKEAPSKAYMGELQSWRSEHALEVATLACIVAFIVIPLVRFVLDFAILAKSKRTLAAAWGSAPKPGGQRLTKWRTAAWKLVGHAALVAMGITVTDSFWFSNSPQFWNNWPEHQTSWGMRAFYACQMAFYLHGISDLLVMGRRRDDRASLLIHHGSSLSLLVISFYFNFLRVGAVVCVINDACDIWFEAAKLASYARREQLSALFYCSFAATWFALRMVYAPLVILPSVWNEAWGLVVRYGASDFHVGLWATFNALLAVLQLQHVYWWYFIAAKIHLTASITIVNNPKRKKRSGSKEGGSFGAGSSTDGEGSSADLVELERLSAGGATGGKRSRASSPGAESE